MCFPYDARPPAPPIAGGAADTELLTLQSEDGTQFAAFEARAEQPRSAAVVVMPDVRGLFPFYEELAIRLAEQGYDAVAIDYFGRTAGVGERDEQFEFMPHVAETSPPQIARDVAAAVARLRERGSADRPIFTVGFCFGGTHSWLQAASGHGLAGAIGFYGMPVGFRLGRDPVLPIDRVGEMRCPVLALQGGADPAIPNEHNEQFEQALGATDLPHEVVVYDGCPHSFFDRSFEEHRDAADDAWRRILGFIEAHSG